MSERNNNLRFAACLTPSQWEGWWGPVAATAKTTFRQSYSLEKSGLCRNPLGAPALGGTLATRSVRITAPRLGPRGQTRSLKFETQMENCYLKPQQAASLWI